LSMPSCRGIICHRRRHPGPYLPPHFSREFALQSWDEWQREVVVLLEEDLEGTANHLPLNEMDWSPWWTLFVQGRSPRSALDHALGRDL
jgi:hypothetical protein